MKYYIEKKGLSKEEKEIYNKINNFTFNNLNEYEKTKSRSWCLGYQAFGILLVGFCDWLNSNVQNDKINNIFFFARDGYIIQKAYKMLYPGEENQYFYASRRSLAFPSMLKKTVDDILNNIILPPAFDLKVLAEALHLKYKEVVKCALKLDIDKEAIFKRSNLKKNTKVISLIKCFENEIYNYADEQSKYFKLYLTQKSFAGNVGIVDIGWHNSMQKSLLKIVNDININGYYFGVYDDANRFNKKNKAKGYLYSYGDNIKRQYRFFSFVSLFETMFLSHEGTTIGYELKGGSVVPKMAKYEYSDEPENLSIIKDFQNGAIKFVEDYAKSDLAVNLYLNANICCKNIVRFGSNTIKKDIKLFEKISFENYAKNNIVNFNYSTFYYILHPKTAINDFYRSGWRIVFLKKLIKIPLPYNFIFYIICKTFNRS